MKTAFDETMEVEKKTVIITKFENNELTPEKRHFLPVDVKNTGSIFCHRLMSILMKKVQCTDGKTFYIARRLEKRPTDELEFNSVTEEDFDLLRRGLKHPNFGLKYSEDFIPFWGGIFYMCYNSFLKTPQPILIYRQNEIGGNDQLSNDVRILMQGEIIVSTSLGKGNIKFLTHRFIPKRHNYLSPIGSLMTIDVTSKNINNFFIGKLKQEENGIDPKMEDLVLEKLDLSTSGKRINCFLVAYSFSISAIHTNINAPNYPKMKIENIVYEDVENGE